MKKILVSLFLLLVVCSPVSAEPESSLAIDDFCAKSQQQISSTQLPVSNTLHRDYDDFVKSKPSALPFITHQYVTMLEGSANTEPLHIKKIISCKMKTSGRIKDLHGEDSAGEEKSCSFLIKRALKGLAERSKEASYPVSLESMIVDEDEHAYMGPMWLNPWPYQTAYLGSDSRVHLRAKAMHIPFSFFIPMPARFKGTHYCHLPAPDYIEAIAQGIIRAQPLQN